MDKNFTNFKFLNVFFIGIGGISMSALAKYFMANGYVVSGSDNAKSSLTVELEKLGATVFYSHNPTNLNGVELVIYSSAISSDNPELSFAVEKGIPCIKRSRVLGEILSRYKRSVAISGCHGKTTATAMLSQILLSANLDPTVFLGGEYSVYGNFLRGNSNLAIAEACEYKKSFLDLDPKIAVVLNIDNDHLDSFDGMADLVSSFKQFVGNRLAVINADEKYINDISNCTTVTFGINNIATYYAKDITQTQSGISFVANAYSKPYGKINLAVKGVHNVYNALSAFAVADMLGVPFCTIKRGLQAFNGVKRRNELLGSVNGIEFYADYAHHPSEIKATLSAFKGNGDFITVFQPHTFSRTRILMKDFVSAFNGQDNLIIYKTYPAREDFDRKGCARTLYKNLQENLSNCYYADSKTQLNNLIGQITKNNGKIRRVVFLGAGDIYQIALGIIRQNSKVQKKILKR